MKFKNTTIDFECLDYTSFQTGEFLQDELLGRAVKKMQNDIEYNVNLARQKSVKTENYKRTVYFIHGSRGAGKTTFLTSLREDLPFKLQCSSSDESIKCEELALFDPTRSEEGEHFLVMFVHLLRRQFFKPWKHFGEKAEQEQKEFCEVWEKIARGIARLIDSSKSSNWGDELLAVEEDYDTCMSGMELGENLGKLIDLVCKRCDCDVLLLAVDDADTHIRKAWDFMEACRKYLLQPRLVLLITGDLNLYRAVVRDRQFMAFDDKLFDYDSAPGRSMHHIQLIDQLEEQYIYKVFPFYNRYELENLYGMTRYPDMGDVFLKIPHNQDKTEKQEDQKEVRLREFLKEIFKRIIEDPETGIKVFLQQPLRMVLQALYADVMLRKRNSNPDGSVGLRSRLLANFMINAYSAQLAGIGIDSQRLLEYDMNNLYTGLLRHCIQINDCERGFYLSCDHGSKNDRLLELILALYLGDILAQSAKWAMKYQFFGPGTVTLYRLGRMQAGLQGGGGDDLESPFYRMFMAHMQVDSEMQLTHWARNACSILCDVSISGARRKPYGPGVIRLRREAKPPMERIPASSENMDPCKYFGHLVALSSTDGSDAADYVSVFNLVACMVDFLDMKVSDDSGEMDERIKDYLYDRTIVRHGMAPLWKKEIHDEAWMSGYMNEDPDIKTSNAQFVGEKAAIKFWNMFDKDKLDEMLRGIREFMCTNNNLHLQTTYDIKAAKLGRAWNYLYYQLFQIVKAEDGNRVKVGELMEKFKSIYLDSLTFVAPEVKECIQKFPLWKERLDSDNWLCSYEI